MGMSSIDDLKELLTPSVPYRDGVPRDPFEEAVNVKDRLAAEQRDKRRRQRALRRDERVMVKDALAFHLTSPESAQTLIVAA